MDSFLIGFLMLAYTSIVLSNTTVPILKHDSISLNGKKKLQFASKVRCCIHPQNKEVVYAPVAQDSQSSVCRQYIGRDPQTNFVQCPKHP